MTGNLDMISGKPIDNLAEAIRRISLLPADPVGALDGSRALLSELKERPPEAILYLTILEEIRKPLRQAVNAIGRSSYHDHALPHMEMEDVAFNRVISSLRLMNQAYAHCDRLMPPDIDARYHAQILHRNIYYVTNIIFEHYRARRDLPAGIWKEAHSYYEAAEQHNIADRPIKDALEGGQSISCAAGYITLLLADIANPYGHSAPEQELIYRLARLGAPLARIEPLDSIFEIPPFILDLGEDIPLHPPSLSEASPTARSLDTKSLGEHMENLHTRLKSGEMPDTVPMGDDQEKVDRLMLVAIIEQLYAPWMQTRITRRFRRHAGHGTAQICSNFEQMHLAISGKPFIQPQGQYIYHDRMVSSSADAVRFGRLESRQIADEHIVGQKHKKQRSFLLRPDDWSVVDQSVNGFRLSRSFIGSSISYGELLAVLPPDDDNDQYVLAEVSWLMQDPSGLHMGLSMLPGIPKAVAAAVPKDVENTAQNASNIGRDHVMQYERAFLLPALEHLGTPPALIISVSLWKQCMGEISLATENNIVLVMLEKTLRANAHFVMVSYKVV